MRAYSLDDKYRLIEGTVYLTGIQALVRLPLDQMRRDRARGRRTACFISGYEGSPLGGYDLALQRVAALLAEHDVRFEPGVNEDLAATAVCGAQLLDSLPGKKVDGVVGVWYGKGPGVDRSGDALRHANLAGVSALGGALALCGDDHVSKSSTIPHQSEFSLMNLGMPILAPGSTQAVLDLGLAGIALSRFCGAWVGLKLATDVCDGGGTVEVSPDRPTLVEPEYEVAGRPFRSKVRPLLIAPDSLEAERELFYHRLEAAKAFARVNGLNVIEQARPGDRLGLVAAGKAYQDLRSALRVLGVGDEALERAGVRLLRLGMVHPLEPRVVEEFVEGLKIVVVVEEKRAFIEMQLRDLLYNRRERPLIYGKTAPDGSPLLPIDGELNAEVVGRALARFLGDVPGARDYLDRLDEIEARVRASASLGVVPPRAPSYCSGCPHNRSTLLFEGQVAGGGIGCHGMASRLSEANRGVLYLGQMGSEGAHWIGMAPFTERRHIFQNLGDGTYVHSGRQAVLAAVAAGVNITFKILYNGVVAMTGGQEVAGGLSVAALTRVLEADGVRRIVIVADDVARYADRRGLAAKTEIRPREDLEAVTRELERVEGVTALIYDQMCAAEKRRRRNRGLMPRPTRRLMIHERVCEGCGDCARKSNCVSLHAVETAFGPKTRIHQSSCNVDESCLLGDCPSFVSVEVAEGAERPTRPERREPLPDLAEPERPSLDRPCRVLMPGIGGTGVVTVNALLATAAVLEGLHAVTLDQTGMAQKGGAVVSHLTISREPLETAQRIGAGATDLLLGFDVLGAAAPATLRRCDPDRTVAVVDLRQTPTGDAVRRGLTQLAAPGTLESAIARSTRAEADVWLDATGMAERLFGSHLQANVLLLGAAYQAGLIPLSAAAIERAIGLNGVAVERNMEAFRRGRAAVSSNEPRPSAEEPEPAGAASLDERLALFSSELTAYQGAKLSDDFEKFVDKVRRVEKKIRPSSERLSLAVAENLFKLTAYKDEYEVARLLAGPELERQAWEAFGAARRIVYHLHPPLLRALGLKRKLALGPWFRPFLKLLARGKFLRGGPLDPFGRAEVRREERALIGWYRGAVEALLASARTDNLDEAFEIARLPEMIRGYEGVKLASAARARERMRERLRDWGSRRAA